MDPENETVVFVEFDDEHPNSVITQEQHKWGTSYNYYDFEQSKRYGTLYHLSGFGSLYPLQLGQAFIRRDGQDIPVERVYWAIPDIQVEEQGMCRRLEALPEQWTAEKLFDGAKVINAECGILWCSECEDYLPDYVPDYCKHIWECWICNEVSTPDERCGHPRGAEEEDEDEEEE